MHIDVCHVTFAIPGKPKLSKPYNNDHPIIAWGQKAGNLIKHVSSEKAAEGGP